jgi:glutamate-1-semialdehyde 2,1-aminomutase
MLKRGIYWPPSPFEAAFLSLSHRMAEIEKTVRAFDDWARKEPKG